MAFYFWKRNIIFPLSCHLAVSHDSKSLVISKTAVSLYRYPVMNHKKIILPIWNFIRPHLYFSKNNQLFLSTNTLQWIFIEYFIKDFHGTVRHCFEDMAIQSTNEQKHSSVVKTFCFYFTIYVFKLLLQSISLATCNTMVEKFVTHALKFSNFIIHQLQEIKDMFFQSNRQLCVHSAPDLKAGWMKVIFWCDAKPKLMHPFSQ